MTTDNAKFFDSLAGRMKEADTDLSTVLTKVYKPKQTGTPFMDYQRNIDRKNLDKATFAPVDLDQPIDLERLTKLNGDLNPVSNTGTASFTPELAKKANTSRIYDLLHSEQGMDKTEWDTIDEVSQQAFLNSNERVITATVKKGNTSTAIPGRVVAVKGNDKGLINNFLDNPATAFQPQEQAQQSQQNFDTFNEKMYNTLNPVLFDIKGYEIRPSDIASIALLAYGGYQALRGVAQPLFNRSAAKTGFQQAAGKAGKTLSKDELDALVNYTELNVKPNDLTRTGFKMMGQNLKAALQGQGGFAEVNALVPGGGEPINPKIIQAGEQAGQKLVPSIGNIMSKGTSGILDPQDRKLFENALNQKGKLPPEMGKRSDIKELLAADDATIFVDENIKSLPKEEALRYLQEEYNNIGYELQARSQPYHAGQKNLFPRQDSKELDVRANIIREAIAQLKAGIEPTQQGMAASTSLQSSLPEIGPKISQVKMFDEVSGKTSQKQPLVDVDKIKQQADAKAEMQRLKDLGQQGLDLAEVEAGLIPPQPTTVPPAQEGEVLDVTLKGYGPAQTTGRTVYPAPQKIKGESSDDATAREVGYQIDNGRVKLEQTQDGWKATIASSGFDKPQIIRSYKKQQVLNEVWKALNQPYTQQQPTVPPLKGVTPSINDNGGNVIPPAEPPSVVPPVQPPAPPPAPPTPPTMPPVAQPSPASPSPVPANGIEDALRQAKVIVERDKPGIITRIIDRIPGLKQLQRAAHPSLSMPDYMIEGWVGQGHAQSTVSNALNAQLFPTIDKLEKAFGKGSTSGGKVNVKYIGPPEKKVPFSNTLYDVMQRPDLYDLSPDQQELLVYIQDQQSALLNKYRDLYQIEIGEFPTAPGAVHLPNVDSTDKAIKTSGSEWATLRRGRAKERFYATGADRYLHDKELADNGIIKQEDVFKPNVNVGALLNADNEALASMSGQNVFKTALGGKTKLELMETTHPDLFNKMTALKKRLTSLRGTAGRLNNKQQAVIDEFLASSYTDEDLTNLQSDLMPALKSGKNVGKDIAEINKEILGVKSQISALQPAWRTANPRGYVFVQDGGLYRYFPAEDAKEIRRLTKTSDSKLLQAIDGVRATAFGGDLSPLTIQGINAWLLDPVGVTKSIAKETAMSVKDRNILRPFSAEALAEDVRKDPESWDRFTLATGLNPLGNSQRAEFGTGFVSKIPKVGKVWEDANDALYRSLIRVSKDGFDSIYQAGIKKGMSPEQAAAIAADDITKLIPSYSYRRLGLSQKTSAQYRAALTSVSFLVQPASMTVDAAKGFIKMGTFQSTTPTEKYAMKRILTLFTIISILSAASGAMYASRRGKDPMKAALAGVTPGDPYFWSLVLPNGDRIGLGGPYRSFIKAIAPGKVGDWKVPVPFAGFYKFMFNKMNPAVRLVYDQVRNKDYFGKAIRNGDFPVNILQGMEYTLEGVLPLTAGSVLEDVRRGETDRIPSDVISQFAGVNLNPIDKVYDLQREWQKDLDKYDAIPTDPIELKASKSISRSDYRIKYPEIDAKLFITGKVSSIKTQEAYTQVLKIMRDGEIDPFEIKSVKNWYDEQIQRKEKGVPDTNITLTDKLMKALTSTFAPIENTNQSTQSSGSGVLNPGYQPQTTTKTTLPSGSGVLNPNYKP
jgi:hypothetical protein